ncbi:MAG: hypothetical protein RIA69_02120 [Cyclobacteriaceae bacterium]
MTKLTLIIALLFLSLVSQAGTENTTTYTEGKVYNIDGLKYRFLGYDKNNTPQFEGFTIKLPTYHGAKKSITKRNRKALKRSRK